MNWGKFGSAIWAFQNSQFPISFKNWRPNFESMDELGEKLCTKFRLTFKNKMENFHKKHSHILNLT